VGCVDGQRHEGDDEGCRVEGDADKADHDTEAFDEFYFVATDHCDPLLKRLFPFEYSYREREKRQVVRVLLEIVH
jgi:hypothetical protein